MATFDFGKTFRKAFGYTAPETDASKINIPSALARRETGVTGFKFYGSDIFGREFFLPVYLNDVLIPFAVVGVKWKKSVISTPLPERGGSVVDSISIDDYEFNIKGILVSDDNTFPDREIKMIHDLFKTKGTITMRNVISDIVLSGLSDKKIMMTRGTRLL